MPRKGFSCPVWVWRPDVTERRYAGHGRPHRGAPTKDRCCDRGNHVMEPNQPCRKQIRLRGYDYAQNNAYFVTICTYKRASLFVCGAEKIAESWLHETQRRFGNVKIETYIIMPDHIHFIITISGDHIGSPLQDIMRWFKTMTTNEYIRDVKAGLFPTFDKHVWQRNYYEHILRTEQEFQETWTYIENNKYQITL